MTKDELIKNLQLVEGNPTIGMGYVSDDKVISISYRFMIMGTIENDVKLLTFWHAESKEALINIQDVILNMIDNKEIKHDQERTN